MTLVTKATSHDHAHGDHAGHDHARHDHNHEAVGPVSQAPKPHAHNHDHAHTDSAASAPRRAHPGFSLLRMSSLQRVALALTLVAAIWLSVFWAWA